MSTTSRRYRRLASALGLYLVCKTEYAGAVGMTRNMESQAVSLYILTYCIYLYIQYFGHVMLRADSLEKTLMLGKTEGKTSTGRQRMRWLDGITDSTGMGLCKLREIDQGSLVCRNPWSCKESDTAE